MITPLLQSLFFLFLPLVVYRLVRKVSLFSWVGPIVLSYAIGLVMANMPYLPVDDALSKSFVGLTVPLAILLLVLPTDLIHWLRYAGSAITSYLLGIVSVVISATAAFYLFRSYTGEAAQISGMLIGIFTGGTPNMSAVGLSLGVDNETFILLNSAEILVGGIYLFFLLSVAQPLLLKILRPFPESHSFSHDMENSLTESIDHGTHSSATLLSIYGKPLLLALAALGAGLGVSYLLTGGISEITIILTVTTVGIGLSFITPIRRLQGSYPVGEYILMIFCIAIGSLANFQNLVEASAVLFLFVTFVIILTILLHILLARLFDIDTDTLIITSAAGIFSPAFVPAIARAIDNEEIMISGLTTGLVGYAVGSYLGILVAWFLG